MLKHKKAIFQSIVEALDGTCDCQEKGVVAGAFNFVAAKLGDNWYHYADILEEYGNEVLAFIEESSALSEELEEFISESGISLCPACGWWGECLEESEEHEELICSDCA